MQTLTPTKDTGATAKADPVVYVEPTLTVTDDDLAGQLGLKGVNGAFIADFLSACLTHERCGTHLYRSCAGRTANPVLQARYQEFGLQTARHVEVLEELIQASGGNPSYVSPLARAVEAADSKALEATYLGSGGIDVMAAEMAMLDAVFMAETVDHANWEALGQLAEMLPDGDMKQALSAAVAEVEEQEDEHLSWARDTRARLTMLQASSSTLTKAAAKGEELVSQVKSWFSGDDLGAAAKQAAASPRKSAPKPAATKKATAKKAASKSAATKKAAAAKKTPAKTSSAATKKGAAKKAATKKGAAKKAATKKKATAKKATARKSPAKKKSAARKSPAKKKSTARKSPAKKRSAAKKGAAKKRGAKKATKRR